MTVKLLSEQHLEFLSLIGGYTSLSESTLVKCHIVENHMSWLSLYLILFDNEVTYKRTAL